jgi:hypothetical protein
MSLLQDPARMDAQGYLGLRKHAGRTSERPSSKSILGASKTAFIKPIERPAQKAISGCLTWVDSVEKVVEIIGES